MDCVRVVVQKMRIPLESAVKCAAVNSAKSVGIYDQYGSITPGKKANLVLLKEEDLSTVQMCIRDRKSRGIAGEILSFLLYVVVVVGITFLIIHYVCLLYTS